MEGGAVRGWEHRADRRPRRQWWHWGGVGVHALRIYLDSAGWQADRQRRDRKWILRTRGGAFLRWEYRPDQRPARQWWRWGGVGVHPLGSYLDSAGRQADRQRRDGKCSLRRHRGALG